ncbi:cation-transporting P-type ATPase [Arhodomonas sp. SL1]|uniref:cation-transporting P-type ATPase n=1 Tax=Arhodomonas sp. SL1 TaxID=3425691 RepID=UPI003F8827F2
MAAEESPDRDASVWHALEASEALDRLKSARDGLNDEEAAARLSRHGPNRLAEQARESGLRRFLRQFHNVLIYILIAAAAGTAALQHWVDTGVILGVVLINALIGFLQEGKAEKAMDAIRGMLSPRATVLRDGNRRTVDAETLVPGDVVLLQPGDRVAADLRLIEARNLRIDEAVLTGESVAAEKSIAPVATNAPLGDRSAMAYSGSLVTFGRGLGVVVATGAATEIGRVSAMLSEVEQLTTPLLRQVAQFGRWLSGAIIVLAAATFAFGVLARGGDPMVLFLAAVSLAVAAIPEGLPAIMTITLAIGVQRMARRNAIIRKLPAVETLGSVTEICSDKTGTLTRNEMTVQEIITGERHYNVSGVGYEPVGGFCLDERDIEVEPDEHPVLWELLNAVVLCNDAHGYQSEQGRWQIEGEPTEAALITAGLKAGLDPKIRNRSEPRTDVIPFDSAHKFMATLHHDHEGHARILVKGAPEAVLALCARERTLNGEDAPLDPERWHRRMDEVAGHGQRLLAVAMRPVPAEHIELTFDDLDGGLTLLGVVGIIDPPREEAIHAVAECQQAGIRVRMITGDHLATARAIGEALGLQGADRALAGHEIHDLDDDTLRERAREVAVFARTTPEHKLRLVTALQADNQVVAMTGDGVNDAPALKRADVGVAMGVKGTEAAKEASEMVLADDNFASIAHAVEEGRTVYDNLKKAILFILPTNGGQAFTIVAAVLLGLALPLEPVQVLWVNMVTAVTLALALAFEPPEPGLMARPPRPPGVPLLTGFLIWRVLFVSALLLIGTFGHYAWMIEWQGADVPLARTVAINTLVVGEMFYLFNSRHVLEPVLSRRGLFGSRPVLLAIAALVALQLAFTYAPPLQYLFGTTAMGAAEWLRVVGFGIALLLMVEAEKAVLRPRLDRHAV